MSPRSTRAVAESLSVLDLIVMSAAFVLATIVTFRPEFDLPYSEIFGMRIKLQNFVLFAGFLSLWHMLFAAFGLYEPGPVYRGGTSEALAVGKAAFCGTLGIGIAALVIHVEVITAMWLPVFWAAATAATLLTRLLVRAVASRRSAKEASHVVIVGTNARALAIAKRLETDWHADYRLVGFVDEHWAGEAEFLRTGRRIACDFAGFHDFLNEQVIDEVFICIPVKSLYDWSLRILAECEQQGITVRFASDPFTPTRGRVRIERFEERSVLTVLPGAMTGPAILIKRLLDVVIASVLLVAAAPLMAVVAIAIRLTSEGPICFAQHRVGLNKRRFQLYKFRTMVVDAEAQLPGLEHRNEASGPVFKIRDDPRVTRVGRFLRETSLDELPQLVNVIKGDMSLVGPRPLPVRDYRGFTQDWHRRRFSVRPGITCLWQVNGRSGVAFDRWMELDMEYIDHWSLMLDMKILLKTIPAVLRRTGAS
jgi:exopolysaccharide biosynthesis polyprenyl glycosylphosphotransferase